MSLSIDRKKITDTKIFDELEFTPTETAYGPAAFSVYAFLIEKYKIHFPFYYAYNILKIQRPERKTFNQMCLKFNGELRSIQKEVKKESVKYLNKTGACIIAMATGYGKTATSINISISIRLPVLVIISRLVLFDQWEYAIKKFCPDARVKKLYTKTKFEEADFYIINAINVCKKGREFYKNIGTVIVDEVHLIATKKLSESLLYVSPRYLLGLSATPTRPDGMEPLLHIYFGPNIIYRKLNRKHIVYKIETGITPQVKKNHIGNLDWNNILTSLAKNSQRNDLIINIVKKYSERNFLILCKRVDHVTDLMSKCVENNVDCTSLVGMKKYFNTESRVLIATCQKAGVGFDHPSLNSLIIAADLKEYFIQYLGRIFRTPEGEDKIPMVFDLVDNFIVLKKHYDHRAIIYKEHGGVIKNMNVFNF